MADGVSVSFLLFFFCFTFESDGFDEGRGMKTKKKSARQIFFCFFSTQNTNKCVKQCSTCCYGRLLLIFCCCSCCCCCCCWTDFPRNWKGFVLFFSLGKGGGGFFFFMFCCSPKRKRRQGNPQNLSAEIPRISEPQIAQFPRFFFFFDQQSRLMERLALILFGTVLAVMNFKTRHSLFRWFGFFISIALSRPSIRWW